MIAPKVPIIIDTAENKPASAVTEIDIGIPSFRISRIILTRKADARSNIISFL